MAIISRDYTIEEYNYIVLGLRILVKQFDEEDDESVYFRNRYNKMIENLLTYAYVTDYDVEDNKITGDVHTKLTEEELEIVIHAVYLSGKSSFYGIEEVDYTDALIKKNEEFKQKRKERKQRISNLYAEYLKSDLVNEKGKKTKVLFYKTYGVTAEALTSALTEFPID